jgi:hypothetical protein
MLAVTKNLERAALRSTPIPEKFGSSITVSFITSQIERHLEPEISLRRSSEALMQKC